MASKSAGSSFLVASGLIVSYSALVDASETARTAGLLSEQRSRTSGSSATSTGSNGFLSSLESSPKATTAASRVPASVSSSAFWSSAKAIASGFPLKSGARACASGVVIAAAYRLWKTQRFSAATIRSTDDCTDPLGGGENVPTDSPTLSLGCF
jgi:hypothetical protein